MEASALSRPFGRPSRALLEPLGARSLPLWGFYQTFGGPFLAQSCGKGRSPHHNHVKGRGRLTTCESRPSSAGYSLSFLSCVLVHVVRANLSPKNRILAQKILKK